MAAAGGEHGKALGFRSCTRHLDMEVSSVLIMILPVSLWDGFINCRLANQTKDTSHGIWLSQAKANANIAAQLVNSVSQQVVMLCRYLHITQHELRSAQGLIQDKANRHAKELEERKTGPQQQRELLLKQLEEDKASRKDT